MKQKARVEIKGKLALLTLENGGQALVPIEELCNIARRFNLELENYECEDTPLKT